MNLFKLFLLLNLIFQILSAKEEVNYDDKKIEDMKSSIWSSVNEGFHLLQNTNLLQDNYNIIAFSDLDGDGYTDIITYIQEVNSITFYKHMYDKEKFIFNNAVELIKLQKDNNMEDFESINKVRNLHIGKLFGDDMCYLFTFTKKESEKDLIHYIKCGSKDLKKLAINSNIIILNGNKDGKGQILYESGGVKKICLLDDKNYDCRGDQTKFDYSGVLQGKCNTISITGGVAYVDIDGNCSPDIILSCEYTNNDVEYRVIQIYLSSRDNTDKYYFVQEIDLGPAGEYGAFTISRVNNVKSEDIAPQFDILVPKIKENKIIAYKNSLKKNYSWGTYFCNENTYEDMKEGTIFKENEKEVFNLTQENENVVMAYNKSFPTVIRPGDFLASSNPGILVMQILDPDIEDKKKVVSLYSRGETGFDLYLRVDNIQKIGVPKLALFFDINESGLLGLIIQNEEGKYSFLYNFRKDTYFIKSKLMNSKEKDKDDTNKPYYDINLGASFRYIVTDKSGDRFMDLSYQLAQTSDMNIPLPYSLVGLGETNNYVENFQIISGNYYKDKDLFYDEDFRNFKYATPVIPNTQMIIFKFKNEDRDMKIDWYIELIVLPMDSLGIIAAVIIAVMLVILGVIIFLHVREVKEEQKETNKFKSWFA